MLVFDEDQDVCLQLLTQAHFIASTKDALDLGRFTRSAPIEQSPVNHEPGNQQINWKSINQSIDQ